MAFDKSKENFPKKPLPKTIIVHNSRTNKPPNFFTYFFAPLFAFVSVIYIVVFILLGRAVSKCP